MCPLTHRLVAQVSAMALLCASALVAAQTTSPSRESPSPQDIDPAVDTSAPPQTPAREIPGPEAIDPAVDTSAPRERTQVPSASSPEAPSGGSARQSAPSAAAAEGARQDSANEATPARRGSRSAVDRIELDTTQITGNRELPKVLYIVPWKRPDLGDLVGKPVNSLLDEVLMPVDRDVFRRENRYYRALTSGESGTAAPAADGAASPSADSSGSVAPAARDER